MEILLSPVKYYHYILLTANIIITFLAAWHALLYKRDPKASLGWLAVILMFPVIGYFLYFLLGVNRIRTRARKLTGKLPFSGFIGFEPLEESIPLPDSALPVPHEYTEIANIVNSVFADTSKPVSWLWLQYNDVKSVFADTFKLES